MINELLWLFFLSMFPIFELRWSIPIGILHEVKGVPFLGTVQGFALDPVLVFFVCVIANIIAGIIVYFCLSKFLHFVLRYNSFEKIYNKLVLRAQKNSKKLIEKYGLIGLALFISIPFPGTGAWTGALVAHFLGISFKKFTIACILGVTLAGIMVTLLSIGAFSFFGFI